MKIRESVDFHDVHEALKPLYDLLGVSDQNIYCEPGITIGLDKITFVVPASLGQSAGPRRAPGVRKPDDYPHPQEGERHTAELAYVVTVPMTGFPETLSRDSAAASVREVSRKLDDLAAAVTAQRPISIYEVQSAETIAADIARIHETQGAK